MRSFVSSVAVLVCACVITSDDDEAGEGSGDSTGAPSTTASTASTSASTTSSSSSASTTSASTSASTTSSTTESTSDDPDTGSSTGEPGCAIAEPSDYTEVEGCAAPVGEPFCSEGQMHVDQDTVVEWMSDPPHSGPHYPTWETWDEHDTVVPRGNWVHNLEHGGIVLAYRCNDDCEPELGVLRDVMAQRPELRILLTPDPLLPGEERFAAMSWTWVHRFDPPVVDDLLCFADQHENHAPEDVP